MPDKTPKVLPCPFCGSKGVAIAPEGRRLAFATCESDECAVVTKGYSTIEEASAAWNRRAVPKPEPLTQEQVLDMNGGWVWVAAYNDGWGYVRYYDGYVEVNHMRHLLDALGKTWLAYTTKPEGTDGR